MAKRIGEITIEDEDDMNQAVNDPLMTPITSFERELFGMLDVESGELASDEMVPKFLELMKQEHSVRSLYCFSPF